MTDIGIPMLKKYKTSFDVWALLLFLIIMMPNFIWAFVPAPRDILRADSVTGTIDSIASICQALMIASLCFLKNSESQKLRATPLIVGAGLCCLLYYLSWFAYYMGMVGAIVVLGLTVPPCLAFLLYAVDRKNRIALIPTLLFTAGHLVYAAANFII